MALSMMSAATFAFLTLLIAIFGDYELANAAAIVWLANGLCFPFVLYGGAIIVGALGFFVARERYLGDSNASVTTKA